MKTLLRILVFAACLFSWQKSAAQYTALWQDFNSFPSLTISGGWTHSWTGILPWRAEEPYLASCLGLPGTNGVNKVAYTLDCGFGNANNRSVLLKTPTLDFTGHGGMYVRFHSHFAEQTYIDSTEEATVEISTNGGVAWTVIQNIHRNIWLGKYETLYVDLGAWSNNDSVRIGFRYNDHGLYGGGWSVDNVKVYKPAQHDVMLVTATPDSVLDSYCVVGDSMIIGGTVYNAGIQPVTEFDVHYQLANGTGLVYSEHYNNLQLAPFDTMAFQHPKRFHMTGMSRQDLKVWLTSPLDTIYSNDTLAVSIRGAAFLPKKTVLLEEGGSNQNANEPQAITYMRGLEFSDYPVALVSIHEGDPMQDSAYSDFVFNFRQHYMPYYFFDRRIDASIYEMSATFHRLRSYFGFADISIRPRKVWSGKVALEIAVKPAVKLIGDYRLAVILTEDDVHGTSSVWAQANRYKNGNYGPMGGFESKPDPVPADSMFYDWVGRSISPEGNGAKCLPDSMAPNGVYSCTINTAIRPGWIAGNMKAIVALIRISDSTVLNAAQVRLSTLAVPEAAGSGPAFRIYPNPAGGAATLHFESAASETAVMSVADITGRLLYSQESAGGPGPRELHLNTAGWPSGMYLLTLQQGGSKATQKLQVLH